MSVLIAFKLVQGGFSSPMSLLLFSLKSSPLYKITSCHSSFHFLAINTSFHFPAITVYEITSGHSSLHFVAITVYEIPSCHSSFHFISITVYENEIKSSHSFFHFLAIAVIFGETFISFVLTAVRHLLEPHPEGRI